MDATQLKEVSALITSLKKHISGVFVGKESAVHQMLLGFFSGLHVLVEDIPGLGKTTLAMTMAKSSGLDFGRIQFTPDILPGDILGMTVWSAEQKEFVYKKGAIMLQFILADEINRTPPKTQAALLEAMQEAGARLVARPRLGQEFFARGMPEKPEEEVKTIFEVSLYDLLKAYADQKRRASETTLQIEAWGLYSVEEALERLRQHVGRTPEWENLVKFLPPGLKDTMLTRSAMASTFSASLELAKEGRLRIRQMGTFGPIFLRGADEGRGEEK